MKRCRGKGNKRKTSHGCCVWNRAATSLNIDFTNMFSSCVIFECKCCKLYESSDFCRPFRAEHVCRVLIPDTCFSLFQNIELKVEVESLKQELEEKQQILDKAL